jgi:tRNA (guanine37-N1)-methyltransferase
MKFEIITLFPEYFTLSLRQSLIGKAVEKKLFDIEIINLRDFATDKHRTVDDAPYGGGGGMVMKIEPLDRCLLSLGYHRLDEATGASDNERIILTSAAGRPFIQEQAIRYSLCERLTIICGHYLGIDERLLALYQVDEVSIGDYILTGGEPAAAVMLDAVARLIPRVLGNFESALRDSYMDQPLGSPCYTRPADYEGHGVPEVLMSGDHRSIDNFRRREGLAKCFRNRPDLLKETELSGEEIDILKDLKTTKTK